MAVSSSNRDRRSGIADDAEPSVSEFVSQASHDLKTPLAAITGYSLTLQRRGDSLDPELRSEMLQHIGGAASRMQSAIEQLVDYARLDLDRIEPNPAVIDLGEALQNSISGVASKYPECSFEAPAMRSLRVVADFDRLSQALSVVLENAAVHGGGRARVSLDRRGSMAVVRVEDAGPGVPEDLEDLIFSADLAARPRLGQPRGLGIALHNARRLLRLQGGDVVLVAARSSGEYPGAVFEIEIPIAEATDFESEGGQSGRTRE